MIQNVVCPRCCAVIKQIEKQDGRGKEVKSRRLCSQCKHENKTIDILCYRCKKIIKQIPAKRTLNSRVSKKLCVECKEQAKVEAIRRITQPYILEKIDRDY